MSKYEKVMHPYHLVKPSPWPLIMSFSSLILTIGIIMIMHQYSYSILVLASGSVMTLLTFYVWWRDVINEGRKDNAHNHVVRKGLSIGMLLFIVSEIMFFAVFFSSFFKASIDPVAILNGEVWPVAKGQWPPAGIKTLDPWNIPFLNTLILLLSGTTVTWAHYSIIENKQKDLVTALAVTVILGVCFTALQAYEYYHAEFKWEDGIYASNFYMATGFHGFHVIVGTIFLFVCFIRARTGHFAKHRGHLGFEFAAWYWHFVDVVWLFLFTFVYVWGS